MTAPSSRPGGQAELLLHIGRHKTGTSSLQRFLHEQAPALRRAGVDYPVIGRGRKIAHHDLALACNPQRRGELDPEQSAAQLRELAALIEANRSAGVTTLLSSEAFQNAKPKAVARQIGHPARILVYLRNQAEYVVSSYAQAVQNQLISVSLEEYEARHFKVDYAAFLGAWSRVFGEQSLTTRVYARPRLAGGDVIADFLQLLPVDRGDPLHALAPEAQRVNASIGGAFLEFKRRLNAVGFQSVIAPPELYRLLLAVAQTGPEGNAGVICSSGFLERVGRKYQRSNASLVGRFLNADDGAALNAAPDRIVRAVSAAGLVDDFAHVAEVLDRVGESDVGTRLLALLESP